MDNETKPNAARPFKHKPSGIIPKLSVYEFLDLSVPADGSPSAEGTYAPHLHMKGIRSKRKTIRVVPYEHEYFELLVPQKFTLADMKQFVTENGKKIYNEMQIMLDEENPYKPAPPTYENNVPYFGADLPIRKLQDADESGGYISGDAVYMKPGLTGDEIRAEALRLMGELAYGIFKPKLDYYTKAMSLRYSRILIDDGRRSFGIYNKVTGDIFLSRRLLMMSEAVIDFLVVHELAHAEVFMHSKEHDAVMGKIMPDYDERDEAFHETCERLQKKGWI